MDGRVVLRFAPSGPAQAPRPTLAAPLDSVVVRVFRSGNPPRQEVSKGAAVGVEPVELSLGCIAEPGKRVSVELFAEGVMTHHGYDTGVDVTPGAQTTVAIDAYPFLVDSVDVAPTIVSDGEAFQLEWTRAPAATNYVVQASPTADFASIAWEQSATDTVLDANHDPGSHYFRVIPKTPYAQGAPTRARFGYVTGGAGALNVTGFNTPAVIPLETVSILGENLDYPGTTVSIGGRPCLVLSVSWGKLDVRVPRNALTNLVTVTSGLGTDFSPVPLVVQRVAYVTSTGQFATGYSNVLTQHNDDFGGSGVVVLPVSDLDTRDMTVFDIILVARDTGNSKGSWGGNSARATKIVESGAGVVAIGSGGATFLSLAVPALSSLVTVSSSLTSYYATQSNATVFRSPHAITNGTGLSQWVDITVNNVSTVALDIDAMAGATLYAATTGVLTNQRWALADFTLNDALGSRRFVFLGCNGDPASFTTSGGDLLGNIMSLLYKERPVTPVSLR